MRLILAGGRVGGIQGVQQLVLLRQVAFFKGIGEDLAGYQGVDGIGVRGLQGAAGAEGTGDVPLCRRLLIRYSSLALPASQQLHRRDGSHCQHQNQHQPFLLFPKARSALFLRCRRGLPAFFPHDFFHTSLSFPGSRQGITLAQSICGKAKTV